jgi:protein TonB
MLGGCVSAPAEQRPSTASPPIINSVESLERYAWRRSLATHVAQHRQYPPSAAEHGRQGTVVVRFAMSRKGRVLSVATAQSSGIEELD